MFRLLRPSDADEIGRATDGPRRLVLRRRGEDPNTEHTRSVDSLYAQRSATSPACDSLANSLYVHGPVADDEALAFRLQLQALEESQATAQPVPDTDEALARRLQAEEDAQAGFAEGPPAARSDDADGDAQLAERLQRAEQEQGPGSEGRRDDAADESLQAHVMTSLGQVAIGVCSFGGTVRESIGERLRGGLQRITAREEDEDDSDPEYADWQDRGLEADDIAGHTVENIFQAPAHGSAGAASADHPGGSSEESKCMVCMEEFAPGDALRTLPCLHRYHATCVDEWLRRSPSCPICKRDITEAQVVPAAEPARPQRGGVFGAFRRRRDV